MHMFGDRRTSRPHYLDHANDWPTVWLCDCMLACKSRRAVSGEIARSVRETAVTGYTGMDPIGITRTAIAIRKNPCPAFYACCAV